MKAKFYKKSGDYQKASLFIEEARKIDETDRFFAMKAARYHLRVEKFGDANMLVMMFGIDPVRKDYSSFHLQ
jgi:hypothetical protein